MDSGVEASVSGQIRSGAAVSKAAAPCSWIAVQRGNRVLLLAFISGRVALLRVAHNAALSVVPEG